MGSSVMLRTHKPTIQLDSNGHRVMKFLRKMSIQQIQEPINEIEEILDEGQLFSVERKDSLEEDNKRGCDEIMLQFVNDLESAYDFVIEEEEMTTKYRIT
jgi:hypothetical protein